ncbi:MAG: site-specific integrase [Spirochaetaceae bacterium]|jgi:integrase|nr:site-specific integrase [Spirochaetaceae bacterium]
MQFHVFKKPKKLKNGQTVKRWYYYYLDDEKKQHQKACKRCKSRKEAEDYIRALSGGATDHKSGSALIKNIARDMFIPSSDHVKRLVQLGRVYDEYTLVDSRRFITRIIETWGERTLASIEPTEVAKHLFRIERGGQWKNRYVKIFNEIYEEAKWQGYNIQKPRFDTFAVRAKKANVLTTAELNALYIPENFPSDIFFVMFLLCVSAGLRLGEIRAVRRKQIFFEHKCILVDGFMKRGLVRTTYNKKGSPENPRLRVAMLPDSTLKRLAEYLTAHPIGDDDYMFSEDGNKPISQDRAQGVFERAIARAGIVKGDRKIVCHSLRYTFVTRMRRELPAETVMKMVGHLNVEQTDYYTDTSAIEESIAGLIGAASAADNLFM